MREPPASIELFWIPLGAGGHCVRLNGRVYEALVAARGRRPRRDLYHARSSSSSTATATPSRSRRRPTRTRRVGGVIAAGPVGSRLLGWWRLFRYEVRCWRGGSIPDLCYAVDATHRLSTTPGAARRLLASAPRVPTPVWGRDELRTGDMWNSNSVAAWLLANAGLDPASVHPPDGGRAPGWDAGIEAAWRQSVNGHRFLPSGGHRISPMAAMFSLHWWPSDLPSALSTRSLRP
jgi:hypothetical protein